jgi:subtilisin family serine protease
VAILDGGFSLQHPDLIGRFRDGYDAIDDDFDPHDNGNGYDEDGDGRIDGGLGHGTFVAGTVLRAAPDTTIVPIRVRDDEGYGSNHALVRGIDHAVSLGVDVMNLSVEKAQAKSRGIRAALNRAVSAGIVVVLSAGNDGADEVNRLAKGTGRIAVGSVDGADRVADFSNREDDLRHGLLVFAPGVDLYGPMGHPRIEANGWWSGTSFSAGYVTGAVALVREISPGLAPEEVLDWIEETSDPIEGETGFLRLNLFRLVLR